LLQNDNKPYSKWINSTREEIEFKNFDEVFKEEIKRNKKILIEIENANDFTKLIELYKKLTGPLTTDDKKKFKDFFNLLTRKHCIKKFL
jgi:hypothetical protein